jgi:hypothetical protein
MTSHDLVAVINALQPIFRDMWVGIPGVVGAWMIWRNSKKVDAVVAKVDTVSDKVDATHDVAVETKRQTDGLVEAGRQDAFIQGVQAEKDGKQIGLNEQKVGA